MIGPLVLALLGVALIPFALGVAEYHDLAGVSLGVSGVLCLLVAAEWFLLALDGAWWFIPLLCSPALMISLGMNLGRWLARRRS